MLGRVFYKLNLAFTGIALRACIKTLITHYLLLHAANRRLCYSRADKLTCPN